MSYKVEILDSTLTPITRIQAPAALNTSGTWLEYSSKLSDYGQAKLRVGTKDPLFTQYGDILQPYTNHVRIYRANAVVWQGVIIKNPHRTKKYIEVLAYDYLYLLSKVLIRHDAADGSGGENYRTFKSGTMATAIQTILTEGKADAGNILSNLQIGTIENPLFPAGYVDFNNASIAGQAWTFSTTFTIKYDYRDLLYVIKSLGLYSIFDFELVNDPTTNKLTFNFQKFLGNRQPDLQFEYNGNYGAIEDYDIPLDGDRMANYLVGVAADNQYNILKVDQSDMGSINKYGKIAGVAAYADAKSKNLLVTRTNEELLQVSTPDSEINCTLNDKAYPLGVYGIGDIITLKVKDHIINVNQQRRIVSINVSVHTTGKETIRLGTNVPRVEQG